MCDNVIFKFTGSSNINRYTSAAVIAILATIAASFLNIAGQCIVAGISLITMGLCNKYMK